MRIPSLLFTALVAAPIFLADTLCAQTNSNEVPLYEGVKKPPALIEADKTFIEEAEKSPGGKIAAANQLINQGWQALDSRDLATAIKRFNQAYLLTPDDYRLYWGLGTATAVKGDYPRAERLFAAGLGFSRKDFRFLSDAGFCLQQSAFRAAAKSNVDPRPKLAEAKKLYQEALAAAPQASLPHARIAVLLFFEQDCAAALNEAAASKKLGGEGLDSRFVTDLEKTCAPLPENR